MKFLSFYIILFLFLSFSSVSQVSIQHTESIKSLSIAANRQLVVQDRTGDFFITGINKLIPSNKLDFESSAPSVYEIRDGQLRKNIGDNYKLIQLPFIPRSVSPFQDGLLIAAEDGVWIYNGTEQLKKFYVPGMNFPAGLSAIFAHEKVFCLLTENKQLYAYDDKLQTLSFIDAQVDGFIIDDWHALWYHKGRTLFLNKTYKHYNTKPPYLDILSIKDQDGVVLSPPVILKSEEDEVIVTYKTDYSLSFNKVPTHYSVNGGKWTIVEGDVQELVLTKEMLNTGRNEVVIKTFGSDSGSSNSVSFQIKVADSSIDRFWPWLFGILTLLFGLNLFAQRKLRNEMKQMEAQQEKTRLQLAIANEKQKLSQLQMNPHFIFNTLNSISGLIALNENKSARKNLNSFAKMMRKVLSHSQKALIPIEEELQFLDEYLSLEKLIRNNKFDYHIDNRVSVNLFIPPMLLQPFLENAIVHGLNPKETKGQLSIVLEEDNNKIKVTIEDNGIGRAKAALNKREGHESTAISIIEQRLKTLNKWDKMGLSYEDLLDDQGTALGTRVIIFLPKRKQ